MWEPVTLTRRQVRAANRVGGIELILPWPDGLAPGAEPMAACAILGAACHAAGLVVVRVSTATLRHPDDGRDIAPRLIVEIVGRRWLNADNPQPREYWAAVERIKRV